MTRLLPVGLPLLLVLAACGGAPPPPAMDRVVVVVIDATHADQMGCYGGSPLATPGLDALAAGGRRFDRAFSNHTWTLPSTTSLFTGQLQERHRVVSTHDVLAPEACTLAELFADAGWSTGGFSQMVYASDSFGLGQGFETYQEYDVGSGSSFVDFLADVGAWVEAHEGERSFLYVHVRRPHSPYRPPPAVMRDGIGAVFGDHPADEFLAGVDAHAGEPLDEETIERGLELYRGNLRAADLRLAPFLEGLLADPRTLVVVTSDHGEAFGQHGHFGHGKHLFAESLDIPLIYLGAGVAPGVDTGPACTVDLVPTLVELCGLEAPGSLALDGESLAARVRGEEGAERREPVLISSRWLRTGAPLVGAVSGDHKLVVSPDGARSIHDRVRDRAERRDLSGEPPAGADDLAAWASGWRERFERAPGTGADGGPALSTAQREALDHLGYADDDKEP